MVRSLHVSNIEDFIKVTTNRYPVTIRLYYITWTARTCVKVTGISKDDMSMIVKCTIEVHPDWAEEEFKKIKKRLEDVGYTVVEGEYKEEWA